MKQQWCLIKISARMFTFKEECNRLSKSYCILWISQPYVAKICYLLIPFTLDRFGRSPWQGVSWSHSKCPHRLCCWGSEFKFTVGKRKVLQKRIFIHLYIHKDKLLSGSKMIMYHSANCKLSHLKLQIHLWVFQSSIWTNIQHFVLSRFAYYTFPSRSWWFFSFTRLTLGSPSPY